MSELSRRNFLRSTAAAGLALPAAPALGAAAGAMESPGAAGATASASDFFAAHEAPSEAPPAEAAPGPVDDPLGVRDLFPVTKELAYLNTASTGPFPLPVRDALAAYADERSTYRDPGSRRRAADRARARFAALFGAEEDEIAFLFSTSDGENLVANGIDWRPGDNVVVDELHFVTAFVVFRELERRRGVELRVVPSREGRARPEDYDARTDAKTRLISVAWVSNRNGFRHHLPTLAEIIHARGGVLYADAIQALGTFPADLRAEGVDFACCNGYKWLFADFGCAPMYVRRERLDWLRPDRYGHGQVAETLPRQRYRLKETASKFEYSNSALASLAALDASLGVIGDVGLDRIAGHTHALAAELRAGAEELGMNLFTPPGNPSPIVSFHHGLDPQALAGALSAEGVLATFQEEGRLLRTAVAMFNNREDVDRLLAAIAKLV